MYTHALRASQAVYPVNSLKSLYSRLKFFSSVFLHKETLKSFIQEIYAMGYSELLQHEIPLTVAVHSPYIHNQWTVEERFKVISDHYKMLSEMPNILNLTQAQPKTLLDLSRQSPNTLITLDKAKWFVREGEIVLNIFKNNLRMMSLAFSFAKLNNEKVIYIGAIQGKQSCSETMSTLKELTKDFEGVRPADFLLEILRMIATNLGISKILAISDENRHHRHQHFSQTQSNLLKTNYNDKWLENGGVLLESGFYALPLKKSRKDFTEIASNKRATYRRRYNMLDAIELQLIQAFNLSKNTQTTLNNQLANTNLYPEASTLANAMFEIANSNIQLGDFSSARKILSKLVNDYPNAQITSHAKERLAVL